MVKVISLSEEAYKRLKKIKNKRSFSELVLYLTANKKNRDLLSFFGKWPGTKEELDKIEGIISNDRKNIKFKEMYKKTFGKLFIRKS